LFEEELMTHDRAPLMLFRRVVLALIVAASAADLHAQVTTASILGTVQDETKAVLPGATVTITNVETGVSRTAITDEQGRYAARQLTLGEYQVQAELQGFQKMLRQGIRLTLGREAVVDLTLHVGELTENVVVSGEAPLIESTNAMVSGHVDERQMRQLPLNARSYVDLSLLQAGTLQSRNSETGFGDTGTHISVAGSRPTATTFLLDGTITTSTRGKAPSSVAGTALGVDSIREFEVITSPYSAEYGRGTGGTISVVSKSGTNRFSGSLFYFHRNDNLDSRNFFDPLDGPPEFKRNQFGFSAGGRIVANRTFFFGNYEGLRERRGLTNIFNAPTDATRQGFVGGRQVPINPEIQPYLDLYPRPNGRDFGDGSAEYITAFSRPTDEDFFAGRIDHELSSNQSIFGRYTLSDASDQNPGAFQMFPVSDTSRSHFVTAEYKSILSPRLLNVVRFGYTHHNLSSEESAVVDVDPSLSVSPGKFMPRLSVSRLSALGSDDGLPRFFRDHVFEIFNSTTYTRGSHTLKGGVQFQRMHNNALNNTRQASRWNFSSIEEFLLGRASRVQIAPEELADPLRNMRQNFLAFFVQDDIRLTPSLTLNAGMRVEWASTITEVNGKISWMPEELFATGTFDDIRTGDPWYDNPGITFAPRAGLAWDPFGDGRTAVRGGFGIFYDHLWSWWMSGTGNYRMGPTYNTFDLRETLPFPMTSAEIVAMLQQRQGRAVPFGNQVYEPDQTPTRQRLYQYGVDIQRQLAGNLVVKAGYKGSRGADVSRVVDVNTAVPVAVDELGPLFSATPTSRNPIFGTMNYLPTDSESFYNALLVEVSKRFSQGYHFQVAYTLSKLVDEGSGVRTAGDAVGGAGGGTVLSQEFRTLDRSLSTFDIRQNFVANIGYELPFGRGRRVDLSGVANALAGGWELNSIVSLATGHPAMFSQGTVTATSILGGSRRPDLIPGGDNNPVLGGPDKYYDPSQFAFASDRRFGNVGRNTLTGPGFATVDFSIIKNFDVGALGDQSRMSLRVEIFNAFNRANFSLPDMEVMDGRGRPNGSAGRIARTATPARQVQLGLRLNW
jgi:hypothetical protein